MDYVTVPYFMSYEEYLKTVSLEALHSMAATNAVIDMWKYSLCINEIARREEIDRQEKI